MASIELDVRNSNGTFFKSSNMNRSGSTEMHTKSQFRKSRRAGDNSAAIYQSLDIPIKLYKVDGGISQILPNA